MSKGNNIIISLSHNINLIKEFANKGTAKETEIMLNETKDQVANEILNKNTSNAIRASVTPQIRITFRKLSPEVEKSVNESQYKIQRLGLVVDEEAKKISERYIEYANRKSIISDKLELMAIVKESIKQNAECIKKGYDYKEGYTPIKLSAQTNEALLNLINEYIPKNDKVGIYKKALQILKERGVM